MTTPEETRDRIKKMRDRIFKESDEDPLENDSDETTQGSDKEPAIDPIENNVGETLQEKESTSEKTKIVQKDEISSKTATPTNLQEKLKQNDDKLSLLGADTQKKISEIAQEFKNKSSILETTILDKIEHTFADSNDKIGEIEHLVNENALSLSQANTALKKEINEINGSIQLDINSVTKRFSTANQEIEKELQNIETVLHNSADKLSQFENSVEERQNSLEENLYEKLQQNSYKLSLLSGETHNQITEITQDFESKSSILETTMLDKLEDTFADSNTKIDRIEHLLNNNSISSSQANKALKERLDELNRSLQLDINSVTKRFSSEDQNIRAELQNSIDKLLKFENSVDERQNSIEESFYEKLQQNGDKLSLLSADTQRQISEIAQEFAIKSSSLETVMLDKLEHTFAESNSKIDAIELLVNENDSSLSQANTALKNEINELNGSLQLDINSVTKRFSSANQEIEKELQNIETELQNSTDKLSKFKNSVEKRQNSLEESFYEKFQQNGDKLSEFENSVEKRQNSLEESFYEKLQQNGDKLSLLNADTQRQISEIAQEFASKSSSLETEILDKLEHTFAESNDKIGRVEQLVNDNILISFQANKALKERLEELNRSLRLDINSVTKRFSSADQKIEKKLQTNVDKLSKFESFVEERQNSLEESFFEKLQENKDKLSSLSADTQKQISEITQEFASKSSSLETTMLDKIEHISFHLKKVEEQIENRISDFSASLQKYVSSITASQEDKIDAQAKKIQDSVKSLKQEIFDNQRDLQADFYKKIKAGEIKTNDYLSERIVEVRELLSGEIESLSEELANLNDVVKEKHSELAKHVDNNVSTITRTAEKDRKSFYNRFEEVTDNIQLVEAKIVKEEELTELFQNYTLNINISDND
jgi:F420-0:gamma-glutamyl ligase-like protein